MPSLEEAREQAWREIPGNVNRTRLYERVNGSGKLERVQLQESLVAAIGDARCLEDEQRIAALVDVHEHGLWQYTEACTRCRANRIRVEEFFHALVGQTARDEVPE